jgi:hypothetical protein
MAKISINDNFLSLSGEYGDLSLLSNERLKNKKINFYIKIELHKY